MKPIGFGFLDRPGVAEQVRLARKAEGLGYDSLWVTETRLARDAFSVLGAMAASTRRIRLGTGIVNSWTRGPGLMAMSFATLSNLAPGRINARTRGVLGPPRLEAGDRPGKAGHPDARVHRGAPPPARPRG